ncbi:MAG: M20/M25/M40 family metallo-hydrolase [Gaiellales bacterium]|nr:MAG: M20/M25/M40 family metallo-hydrolase [Gaiellales bacterium]
MTEHLSQATIVALALLAAAVISLTVTSCGGDEEPSTPGTIRSAAEPLEEIYLPPPPPPPGRAPDPPSAGNAVDDTLQLQLESILSAYDNEYQYGIITELASDRYQGRRTGSDGARAAAAFIAAEFGRLGLQPWSHVGLDSYYHHFSGGGLEDDNIIGVLPGSNPGGAIVILAAHYDHLGMDGQGNAYNGADDNAAGVATILEAAANLRSLGYRPADTIVFCAFSGEEQGQVGAGALGRLITDAGLAGRVEMINIDGIGATGGDYLGVWDEGSAAAAPLVATMSQAGSYLGTTVINEGTDIGSDAQPFAWEYGIPAITVDWDWGSNPSAYHPYYHTIHDDAGAIDRPTLARATRVILVGLWLRAYS